MVPTLGDFPARINEERLGDGVDDALGVCRKGNVDPGGALDLPHLAQENIQHDAVNGVVGAIQQAGFHLGGNLPETVYTPFALFQAVRIPGKIVMKDGSELVLKVDTLAETVGGHQHPEL